ncbi:uncharacterized protein [Erythrolamprus reginae]|uniref:uncharacterized protein n=1 Tax=Erythrolamprus reginae TaxID=121349 RepID=UPI00396CBD5D
MSGPGCHGGVPLRLSQRLRPLAGGCAGWSLRGFLLLLLRRASQPASAERANRRAGGQRGWRRAAGGGATGGVPEEQPRGGGDRAATPARRRGPAGRGWAPESRAGPARRAHRSRTGRAQPGAQTAPSRGPARGAAAGKAPAEGTRVARQIPSRPVLGIQGIYERAAVRPQKRSSGGCKLTHEPAMCRCHRHPKCSNNGIAPRACEMSLPLCVRPSQWPSRTSLGGHLCHFPVSCRNHGSISARGPPSPWEENLPLQEGPAGVHTLIWTPGICSSPLSPQASLVH